MRVTIREVAASAGVSAMTVSRVINESPRVSDETRRRVEAAIAELGYVPNRLASGLIRKKTGALRDRRLDPASRLIADARALVDHPRDGHRRHARRRGDFTNRHSHVFPVISSIWIVVRIPQQSDHTVSASKPQDP